MKCKNCDRDIEFRKPIRTFYDRPFCFVMPEWIHYDENAACPLSLHYGYFAEPENEGSIGVCETDEL